jgi:hypothetical protein
MPGVCLVGDPPGLPTKNAVEDPHLLHITEVPTKYADPLHQDLAAQLRIGPLQVLVATCDDKVVTMDHNHEVPSFMVESAGTGSATGEAQGLQLSCCKSLPKRGGITSTIETAHQSAAKSWATPLRGEFDEQLPLSEGVQMRLFGIQKHNLAASGLLRSVCRNSR